MKCGCANQCRRPYNASRFAATLHAMSTHTIACEQLGTVFHTHHCNSLCHLSTHALSDYSNVARRCGICPAEVTALLSTSMTVPAEVNGYKCPHAIVHAETWQARFMKEGDVLSTPPGLARALLQLLSLLVYRLQYACAALRALKTNKAHRADKQWCNEQGHQARDNLCKFLQP